jgi:hypothetical protein
VVHSPERPGAAHPGLDLVRDEQGAVPGAQIAGPRQVLLGRHDAAGLSLHRLHHESRHRRPYLLRFGELRLQRVRVAVRHEAHVLQPARERLAERAFSHERERAHGLAVKPAEGGNEEIPPGVEPGELDGSFDGVGAVVDEEGVREVARGDHRQQPGQPGPPRLQQLLAVERHPLHLAGDGVQDPRVIHPGAEDPVAAETVDVLPPEQVAQDRAAARPLQGRELPGLGHGLPVPDEAAVDVPLVRLDRLRDEGVLLIEGQLPPLDQLEVTPAERQDLVVRMPGQADLISVQI